MKRTINAFLFTTTFMLANIALNGVAFAKHDIITRDIAPQEVFEHSGPIEIRGNIGAGATITITDGGVKITGHVADGAKIETHTKTISQESNTVVVTTNSNSTVIINGKVVSDGSNQTSPLPPQGIEVQGKTGKGVRLDTDGSIAIANANQDLIANAGGSVIAENIASTAKINAGGSIVAGNIGKESTLSAGGSITGEDIGQASNIRAGGSITAHNVEDAALSAGGSIIAESAKNTNQWHASGSIIVSRNRPTLN